MPLCLNIFILGFYSSQILSQQYLKSSRMAAVQEQRHKLQEETFRFTLLSLFKTNVKQSILPLHHIEIISQLILFLQILKFPIDYYSIHWFERPQPIFSFLDPLYYFRLTSRFAYQIAFLICLAYMNLYWLIQLSSFLMGKKTSSLQQNIKKLFLVVSKNILFLPLANIAIHSHNCSVINTFILCHQFNQSIALIFIISFFIFFAFILAQSYLSFSFLPHPNQFRRLKRSSLCSTSLLLYAFLNELMSYMMDEMISLAVLNISAILLIMLFLLKDQEVNERVKLFQYGFLVINLYAILLLDILIATDTDISIAFFFFLSPFIIFATMNCVPHSLNFQLENINKWHNSEIMIRYAQNLRYYMSRVKENQFKIYLLGYIQVHKQKCDNDQCPLRSPLTENQKQLFDCGRMLREDEFILRLHNLVKKIYLDGYQQTPISPLLQLQYSIFLYEKDEKQLSLKKLLLIEFSELSFETYYKYNILKNKIHNEMQQEPNKIFLDLVSQLQVKKDQRIILGNFEKVALINLQFWSLLKEDHPNFKKLNQIGAQRIKIREQIRSNYQSICNIVNSQKITSIYVHYLECIQNDEWEFNLISERVMQHFNLDQRILLEDWINSSNATLLVSTEQHTFANIIDINTTCSSLFGYQRYELLNRPVKYLFPNQEDQGLKHFIASNNREQVFILAHKNGFLLKIKKISKIYNSLQTGLTAIISISSEPIIDYCLFALRKDLTIIGSSSSIVSLIGIQSKLFQKKIECKDFFKPQLQQLKKESSEHLFSLKQLIKSKYDSEIVDKEMALFRIRYRVSTNYDTIELVNAEICVDKNKIPFRHNKPIAFQFQVQADLQNFKYFGSAEAYENYVSQFSQLQYADSCNNRQEDSFNYAHGITTLRLNYDIIQVIQQGQDDALTNFKGTDAQDSEVDDEIQRKYQEEIFQSKDTFENFIKDYSFAQSVIYVFLLWIIALLAIYIAYFLIYQVHNAEMLAVSNQITYQNLILGSVAKEESLVNSLEQMKTSPSPYSIGLFKQIYAQNVNYLEGIKLKGVEPYELYLKGAHKQDQKYFTNQFILTFIKQANYIGSSLNSATTQKQVVQLYGQLDPLAISYILQNGKKAKYYMINEAFKFVSMFKTRIGYMITVQILMFVGGIIFLALFTLTLLLSIHRINKERIRIFSIFLDISDIKIQFFSSNTEKFLASLHTEDPNSEIDVDEEVENMRKIYSSTFAKKKKLIQINFNKLIYVKFLIIPLIASIFFVQSFVENYVNLKFYLDSYHYFSLTSYGDYKFYQGLSQIQNSFLKSQQHLSMNDISAQYFEYYHQYFQLHFNTLGKIQSYHQVFTYVFMSNICQGRDFDVYGNIRIETACNLPELSQNGSYLIFSDMAIKTSFLTKQDFNIEYIEGYQVLSQTHRMLSKILLKAMQIKMNTAMGNLLSYLLIWAIVVGIISFIFGLPIIKFFIDEINLIKNIITIIPISLVQELPLAKSYLNKILKEQNKC